MLASRFADCALPSAAARSKGREAAAFAASVFAPSIQLLLDSEIAGAVTSPRMPAPPERLKGPSSLNVPEETTVPPKELEAAEERRQDRQESHHRRRIVPRAPAWLFPRANRAQVASHRTTRIFRTAFSFCGLVSTAM